jgi:hypothetical protein
MRPLKDRVDVEVSYPSDEEDRPHYHAIMGHTSAEAKRIDARHPLPSEVDEPSDLYMGELQIIELSERVMPNRKCKLSQKSS